MMFAIKIIYGQQIKRNKDTHKRDFHRIFYGPHVNRGIESSDIPYLIEIDAKKNFPNPIESSKLCFLCLRQVRGIPFIVNFREICERKIFSNKAESNQKE
mmetsp:Transcript_16573/g.25284  ORF Transcript_16573/g.25284 Transcript_16573/m.25284 type:complete len:100 (+) Transcript_16573:208-507(+)